MAVVIEMTVCADGGIGANTIYRALVRNKAQLTYSAVGPWLEGKATDAREGRGLGGVGNSSFNYRTKQRTACARRAIDWARSRSTVPNCRLSSKMGR